MNWKIRISGFTLIELSIAIAVGVVVVGIGFRALELGNSSSSLIEDAMDRMVQRKRTHWIIHHDVFSANAVLVQNEGFMCILQSDTVEYRTSQNYLIRSREKIDTLLTDILNIRCFFKTTERFVTGALVDELCLETNLNQTPWYFSKWYDLKTLRQYEH